MSTGSGQLHQQPSDPMPPPHKPQGSLNVVGTQRPHGVGAPALRKAWRVSQPRRLAQPAQAVTTTRRPARLLHLKYPSTQTKHKLKCHLSGTQTPPTSSQWVAVAAGPRPSPGERLASRHPARATTVSPGPKTAQSVQAGRVLPGHQAHSEGGWWPQAQPGSAVPSVSGWEDSRHKTGGRGRRGLLAKLTAAEAAQGSRRSRGGVGAAKGQYMGQRPRP